MEVSSKYNGDSRSWADILNFSQKTGKQQQPQKGNTQSWNPESLLNVPKQCYQLEANNSNSQVYGGMHFSMKPS